MERNIEFLQNLAGELLGLIPILRSGSSQDQEAISYYIAALKNAENQFMGRQFQEIGVHTFADWKRQRQEQEVKRSMLTVTRPKPVRPVSRTLASQYQEFGLAMPSGVASTRTIAHPVASPEFIAQQYEEFGLALPGTRTAAPLPLPLVPASASPRSVARGYRDFF